MRTKGVTDKMKWKSMSTGAQNKMGYEHRTK